MAVVATRQVLGHVGQLWYAVSVYRHMCELNGHLSSSWDCLYFIFSLIMYDEQIKMEQKTNELRKKE